MINRRTLTAALVSGAAAVSTLGALPAAEAAPHTTGSTITASALAPAAVAARTINITASSPASNIKALQHLLTAYGYPTTADGSYGPATRANVEKYQRAKGLAVDGAAGPNTMGSMVGGANTAVKEGWTNKSTVRAVQQLLVKVGYNVAVDGSYGPASRSAVRAFQTKHGLPVTAVVDYTTWSYLFNPPATTTGIRTGPVVLMSQYGAGNTSTQDADCGPVAFLVVQLRVGKTPTRWTTVANRGPAILYARRTVLGMSQDSVGTRQIRDAYGILAGFQKVGMRNPGIGYVRDAAAAVRAGGVSMILGRLSVARSWQGKPTTSTGYHWVAVVDYRSSDGKYLISDSSHTTNRLVWVTESQMSSFQITSEPSAVWSK